MIQRCLASFTTSFSLLSGGSVAIRPALIGGWLLLALRVILDGCIYLLRDREIVAVLIFRVLVIRALHFVEMGAHYVGVGPACLQFAKSPNAIGTGFIGEVNSPVGITIVDLSSEG